MKSIPATLHRANDGRNKSLTPRPFADFAIAERTQPVTFEKVVDPVAPKMLQQAAAKWDNPERKKVVYSPKIWAKMFLWPKVWELVGYRAFSCTCPWNNGCRQQLILLTVGFKAMT